MDVRVVTVTARPTNPWFEEALASVARELPAGARHVVVHSTGRTADWNRDLWGACLGADAVAIVDDDDRVLPGALTRCLSALEVSGAGLAFTDEEEIDVGGRRVDEHLRVVGRRVDALDAAPGAAHLAGRAAAALVAAGLAAPHPADRAHRAVVVAVALPPERNGVSSSLMDACAFVLAVDH